MGRSSTARKAAPRDAASKVAQQRLSVLELASELGNVALNLAAVPGIMAVLAFTRPNLQGRTPWIDLAWVGVYFTAAGALMAL